MCWASQWAILMTSEQRLAPGELEPLSLGVAHGYARELAHGGPAELTAGERSCEGGQALQRFRHAQPFLKRASLVAEQAFDVFAPIYDPRLGLSC
jgi:hypothetical protein